MSDDKSKVVIVKSSTMAKYGRMDAGFYMGQIDGEDPAEKVEAAVKQLQKAETRLQNALAAQEEAAANAQRMIDEGEVVPWPPKDSTNSSD